MNRDTATPPTEPAEVPADVRALHVALEALLNPFNVSVRTSAVEGGLRHFLLTRETPDRLDTWEEDRSAVALARLIAAVGLKRAALDIAERAVQDLMQVSADALPAR